MTLRTLVDGVLEGVSAERHQAAPEITSVKTKDMKPFRSCLKRWLEK